MEIALYRVVRRDAAHSMCHNRDIRRTSSGAKRNCKCIPTDSLRKHRSLRRVSVRRMQWRNHIRSPLHGRSHPFRLHLWHGYSGKLFGSSPDSSWILTTDLGVHCDGSVEFIQSHKNDTDQFSRYDDNRDVQPSGHNLCIMYSRCCHHWQRQEDLHVDKQYISGH